MHKAPGWVLLAGLTIAGISPAWAQARAASPDQDAARLEKELTRTSLVASDQDGRRIVNRVMASQLNIQAEQLVKERRQTGFTYGKIFLAHQIARLSGLSFLQVSNLLRSGFSVYDIAQQQSLDLKPAVAAARKLNQAIGAALERDAAVDAAKDPSYDPAEDFQPADVGSFSAAELRQVTAAIHHRGAAQPASMSSAVKPSVR